MWGRSGRTSVPGTDPIEIRNPPDFRIGTLRPGVVDLPKDQRPPESIEVFRPTGDTDRQFPIRPGPTLSVEDLEGRCPGRGVSRGKVPTVPRCWVCKEPDVPNPVPNAWRQGPNPDRKPT